MDVARGRETTIRPAGTGLRQSGGPTTLLATQPPNSARGRHGMVAATHRTPLIRGKRRSAMRACQLEEFPCEPRGPGDLIADVARSTSDAPARSAAALAQVRCDIIVGEG